MTMDWLVDKFKEAQRKGSGLILAETLLPPCASENTAIFDRFYRSFGGQNVRESLLRSFKEQGQDHINLPQNELLAWIDIYAAYWAFLENAINHNDQSRVRGRRYEAWKNMSNLLVKGYSSGHFESWTLPCLYVAGRWLRHFAIEADQEERELGKDAAAISMPESDDISATFVKNDNLEDAARVINRMFTLCITDRAPILDSRKWALYYITNLLFKTYFKLNSVSLCKNPWRALQASHVDMPPIEAFPKSHICTFKYYVGLMFFLEEEYDTAETNLTEAYQLCHRFANKNRELILSYLIPCRLVTKKQLPRSSALLQHPRLDRLFNPVCKAILSGNLSAFDSALDAGEDEFIRARIYLTLERGRDICLRNLFRKVFLAGGFEDTKGKEGTSEQMRRTRISIGEFVVAVQCSLKDECEAISRDEVECLLANGIHKGLAKGYIARERGIIVLSKGNAFPGTGV